MADEARLTPVADVSVGSWIAPRLGPFGAQVGSVCPGGFDAYARLLHPVTAGDGRPPTTWAAVCDATGREAHALMQWNAIAGAGKVRPGNGQYETSRWAGGKPEQGNLDSLALERVCEVLAEHTSRDTSCFFALWEGWGWIHGSPAVAVVTWPGEQARPVPPAFPDEVIRGPRLRHPARNYLLFAGPLIAARQIGWQSSWNAFFPQSPNLFWPEDRSWCVATEIDFDSTIVAGDERLVASLLAAPDLEVWRVSVDDSLAHTADTVNS